MFIAMNHDYVRKLGREEMGYVQSQMLSTKNPSNSRHFHLNVFKTAETAQALFAISSLPMRNIIMFVQLFQPDVFSQRRDAEV